MSSFPDPRKPSVFHGTRSVLVVALAFVLILPSLMSVNSQDPEVLKVGGKWQAEWDFSHPGNYTFNNTTIDNGQLVLDKTTIQSLDGTVDDFNGGTKFQVRVTPTGSVVLTHKTGTGFTEIGNQAGVDDAGNGLSTGWADHDRDGLQDLFVGVAGGTNLLYENNGDGTFTEVASTAGVDGGGATTNRAAIWGDYNNDGDLDLFSTTAVGLRLWHNNGDGTFTERAGPAGLTSSPSTEGVAWLDFDHDGWLDIYQPVDGGNDHLFQNNGDGTFTEVGNAAGIDDAVGFDAYLTVGDYDGDGWTDLLKSMEIGGVVLYKNDQDGTFTDTTAAMNLSGITVIKSGLVFCDVDNDGRMDIYHADAGQDLLYVNQGNEYWEVATSSGMTESYNGRGVTAGDFDLDGSMDIFVGNDNDEDIIWMNNGDGTFTDLAPAWGMDDNGQALGTAAADFDNDGDMDIFVVRSGQADRLYQNDHDSENVVKFRLEGNGTNWASIGAILDLYEKGDPDVLVGVREVTSGSGRGSGESLEQVFGANASKLHKAVVKFPGGDTVTIDDIEPPVHYLVNESGTVTELPLVHHYYASGNFTSRSHDLGKVVSWNTLDWNADVPVGTSLAIKTRTSPDGSSWTTWSAAYTNGEQIKSPKDRYIQYWVEFGSTDPDDTPELHNLTLSYTRYNPNGTAVTRTHYIEPAAITMEFKSFGNNAGHSISFSYSNDRGATWVPIPPDGNLSSEHFNNITLRAELATTDELVTPSVNYMRITYTQNRVPVVRLISPETSAIVPEQVDLEWNGTDPDGHDLLYDIFMGTTIPYPMIVENLTVTHYRVEDLVPGRTYFWYVAGRDQYGGRNLSSLRVFTVNSLPEVDLLEPADRSILLSNTVTFEWFGFDFEDQNLTYDLYLEKDGKLKKETDCINATNITLKLENLKSYRWYVVVDDGDLSNQSLIWSFDIDAPINHLPQVTSIPPMTGEVGIPYIHQLDITDLDGDVVKISFIPGIPIPASMTMTPTGLLHWTPATPGVYEIGILLDDSKDQVKYHFNITVFLAPPNQPPQVSKIDDVVLKKKSFSVDLDGHVTDDEPITEITWTFNGEDAELFTVELNGSILTITPMKDVKGQANLTVVATDADGDIGETTFIVTVENKRPSEEDDFMATLCALWPIFLVVLILVVIAFVMLMRSRSRVRRPKRGRIETWDEMKDELYEEKRKEKEDEPKFRGAVGASDEDELMARNREVMEMDEEEGDYGESVPVYEATEIKEPVFGASMNGPGSEEEEPRELERDIPETKVWTPGSSDEETKVFKDEKTVKAQQDDELDDILDKLKVSEKGTPEPPKEEKGKQSLDDLLKKLKK